MSDARFSGNCNDSFDEEYGQLDVGCPDFRQVHPSDTVVLEVVEITGRRQNEPGWRWTDSSGWSYNRQVLQSGGSGPRPDPAEAARNAISDFEVTCRPAGMTDQQYYAAQSALCVAEALEAVDSLWYRILTGIGWTTVQGLCNARIADQTAANGIPNCTP